MNTDTLVIGGGPAGLAVAACVGPSAVVLERSDGVGHAWRNHYTRLHLHTSKRHSALPMTPFPATSPLYPSREQVLSYLEDYARVHAIAPRFNVAVTRIERSADGYRVHTNEGERQAKNVVVATGYNAVPVLPELEGHFDGQTLHSRDYRDGKAFKGQRVLVVGVGNTGAEIALDLLENGAKPTLVVRSPIHLLPRDFLGTPTQVTTILLGWLPLAARDAIGVTVSRWAFGDLSTFGITRPSEGPVTQIIRHGRIPVLDIGTVAAIRRGDLPVKPALSKLLAKGGVFADGSIVPFDAIVFATGYRTGLQELVAVPDTLDERGVPTALQPSPGLFFVGFNNVPTGLLRQIAHEARVVARHIEHRGLAHVP